MFNVAEISQLHSSVLVSIENNNLLGEAMKTKITSFSEKMVMSHWAKYWLTGRWTIISICMIMIVSRNRLSGLTLALTRPSITMSWPAPLNSTNWSGTAESWNFFIGWWVATFVSQGWQFTTWDLARTALIIGLAPWRPTPNGAPPADTKYST